MEKTKIEIDDNKGLFNELLRESDRGVAILGFTLIERDIESICQTKLSHAPKKQLKALLNGPLQSTSARIVLARCAGWLTGDECDVLDTLRWIRNEVAHNPTRGLDEPYLRNRIDSRGWAFDPPEANTRDRVLILLAHALNILVAAQIRIDGFTDVAEAISEESSQVAPELMSTGTWGTLSLRPQPGRS